ncbi:MAG: hypothetical protein AUJ52_09270 [Elusimicrobia bacterium CG1_02_63_36]|nr:MAG: hypothetical protein AUJ52_09270 [Elusimicrobia bacterium CG1_02_63_36]PIP84539.1 MAG: hypothetical protein COR54_03615 [Elusimicrobia bacterium CG22_combo_CG10-13_8_21_14_all_63_91]PJA14574.1 MAG: hypothetical protein COX66_12095 [Elusimicrobia bacterium CG_4_10_14_0_2_um_filter_63_34]PJB26844.1 MAG: hypothetical protein CO113_01525 [Elusimicrobia bacterium CG_4_9_14_3_um_filter_62_55]
MRYFGRADDRLFEPIREAGAARAELRSGWPEELAGVARDALTMEDARGYADTRLGALGALAAAAADEGLELSAAAGTEVPWPASCTPHAAWRLNFPGTTNGFRARFARCAQGGYALALDRFWNRSLFLHELALLKILLETSPLRAVFSDSEGAGVRDDLLLAAFSGASALPREFNALALGYYDELKEEFSPREESLGGPWRGFSTRVGTTTLVALAIEDSWYGETLGASVARLLDSGVSFQTVYFAGSAGALVYRPPYSLAHPKCYLSRAGGRIDLLNEFSGAPRSACHLAVASPLVETHALLDWAETAAETVDVEGFELARAAAARGVRLGTAYLATDYPRPAPVLAKHRLAETRTALRRAGARAYARLLRRRLETGARAYRHPIEEALQGALGPFSAEAARTARRALGDLSELEWRLFDRIAASVPPVWFRTRPARPGPARLRRA